MYTLHFPVSASDVDHSIKLPINSQELKNWNKNCMTHVTCHKDKTLMDSQTSACASPLCTQNTRGELKIKLVLIAVISCKQKLSWIRYQWAYGQIQQQRPQTAEGFTRFLCLSPLIPNDSRQGNCDWFHSKCQLTGTQRPTLRPLRRRFLGLFVKTSVFKSTQKLYFSTGKDFFYWYSTLAKVKVLSLKVTDIECTFISKVKVNFIYIYMYTLGCPITSLSDPIISRIGVCFNPIAGKK